MGSASEIVAKLNLAAHPEDKVECAVSLCIYFLLLSGNVSSLHHIPCAETWHFSVFVFDLVKFCFALIELVMNFSQVLLCLYSFLFFYFLFFFPVDLTAAINRNLTEPYIDKN
ncbi:hypothetical protein CFP56_002362 [Quercus suber]|uniref:Uncharacterized protein n=1 Tax=Quercus suber TaxID=58331 RepID=A0AAW0IL05_QUESU